MVYVKAILSGFTAIIATDLLSSSIASKTVTKTITVAITRFFAPTHTSPQHLGLRKVCSRGQMMQQLHPRFVFSAAGLSEKIVSTFS